MRALQIKNTSEWFGSGAWEPGHEPKKATYTITIFGMNCGKCDTSVIKCSRAVSSHLLTNT